MQTALLAFLVSFAAGLILGPLVISFSRRVKAGQTILHYVEAHKSKEGTPTMGGLIFLGALSLGALFFLRENSLLAIVSVAATLGYGLLGFLDDFIKIKFKQNLGLRAYQKFIGQVGIAGILAVFAYLSPLVGSTLYVPFTLIEFDVGFFIIPIVMFIYLALTNSVNLTDGLDGLAGGTSLASIAAFTGLIFVTISGLPASSGQALLSEYSNLILVSCAFAGAILAFLCFNSYPAKIFMGDTGSLALGGFIASIAVFTHQILLLPVLCVVFMASTISVILQVLYFKRTKKRIFLMAPLHHHFEKKGVHESRIVAIYIIVTILAGAITLAVML